MAKKIKTALKAELDNYKKWATGLENEVAILRRIKKILQLYLGIATKLESIEHENEMLQKRRNFLREETIKETERNEEP